MKNFLAFFLIFFSSPIFQIERCKAAESPYATEVDIKAAYCVSVLKETINVREQAIMQKGSEMSPDFFQKTKQDLNRDYDNLSRLQSYLLPKLEYLEGGDIDMAFVRGRKDFFAALKEPDSCLPCSKESNEKQKTCLSHCAVNFVAAPRIRICNKLEFLPY